MKTCGDCLIKTTCEWMTSENAKACVNVVLPSVEQMDQPELFGGGDE